MQSSKYDCRGQGVCRQMNPVLYTLSVFGINLHRNFEYPCHKTSVANVVWCVYSTVVLLFLVTNFCRFMGVFQQDNSTELHLIFNIQSILFMGQNVGHHTVFYIKFLISSKFSAFLTSYQEYADEYKTEIISIKRVAHKCVAVYGCLLLLHVAFDTHYIFVDATYNAIIHWPLHENNKFKIVMELIYTVFVLLVSAIWFGTTLITCFVSICLMNEYKAINREMLKLSHSDFLRQLDHYRRRHYKVGNLTGLFNKFISLQFAIDASCDLTQCCLVLYELIWDPDINNVTEYTMIYVAWVTIIIAKVIIVFFCAGILNDYVSSTKSLKCILIIMKKQAKKMVTFHTWRDMVRVLKTEERSQNAITWWRHQMETFSA